MTKREQKIIHETIQLLKKDYIHDVAAHDWFHIERVWKMARKLAKQEKVNQFILEMAALLHDVDDYKFKKPGEGELVQTEAILDKFNINKEREQILEIVKNVSYKGAKVATNQNTLEGKIVQDADRLDAMGAVGIARSFAFNGFRGNVIHDPSIPPRPGDDFNKYKLMKSTAINHFYEKLLLVKDRLNTLQAKRIAVRRHRFLKEFLTEFFRELKETE